MQALIDGDILVYEIGATAQYINEAGEIIPRPWDWVEEAIDYKIRDICKAVGASLKPLIYLTGDEWLWKTKRRVRPSLPPYEPNFRIAMAVSKDYKGGRKVDKPIHYNNIRAYLIGVYDAHVSIGCEADDEMAIEQTRRNANAELPTSIICTRDKDLRQVEGWHYGWECGKQGEFGPLQYDSLGTIVLDRSKSSPKIVGGGFKFFCSQLFTGDPVDSIGGLGGYGPVKVGGLILDCLSTKELLNVVRQEYEKVHPEDWKTRLREQSNLLWMVRERDNNGRPVMFDPKEYMNG
jgi:hypothetical protein